MAANSRRKSASKVSTTRQSEALQFFHEDDIETSETSGEYTAEDSTSVKVRKREPTKSAVVYRNLED